MASTEAFTAGRRKSADKRVRDALIIVSMAMAALAVGIGVFVQFGLAFWLAILAALAAYVSLLCVHVVIRRAGHVAELEAELESLRARLGRSPAHGVAPAAASAGWTAASPYAPASTEAWPNAAPQSGNEPGQRAPAYPAMFDAGPAGAGQGLSDPAYGSGIPGTYRPGSGDGFGAPPLRALPHAATQPDATMPQPPAPPNDADSIERLHGLIKKLADDIGGPRATTPDPDRLRDGDSYPASPWRGDTPEPPADRAAAVLSQTLSQTATFMAAPPIPSIPAGMPRHRATAANTGQARLAEAIAAERVDVYLEPIQALGERRPQHFEVSVRFRDAEGQELDNEALRAAGLSARADTVKLPRVLRVAERVKSRGRAADVLAGVAGESLTDDAFLERFASDVLPGQTSGIVLAFSQADVRGFGPVHWDTLATMAEIGVRFALDAVVDLDLDFEQLRSVGFAFVKLDATVFVAGLPAPGGIVPAADLCRHLSGLGLALIVGRIDDEWMLARVMGFGAPLGQGALFGAPRPVRADVLAGQVAA